MIERMFSGNRTEREASQQIELCQKYTGVLETISSEMQDAIDISPTSPEEQKALLKELRLRKKELQAQKRETTTNMRLIREEARRQSVHAGRGFLGIYDSKLASNQRRQIRYQREAALRPNEDQKAAIERQLIQVERDILWVEKLKE